MSDAINIDALLPLYGDDPTPIPVESFTEEDDATLERARNGYMIHNHPEAPSPHSVTDMQVAQKFGLKSVVIARVPETGETIRWTVDFRNGKGANANIDYGLRAVDMRFRNPPVPGTQGFTRTYDGYHAALTELSREGGFGYKREIL